MSTSARSGLGWLPWVVLAMVLLNSLQRTARWEERLRLADQATRAALDSAARRAARLDSLRALLAQQAEAARRADQRARQLAEAAALRAESLATMRDSLLRVLPPTSPEHEVIAAETEARAACERRVATCEAVVSAITQQLAASDSLLSLARTQAERWREIAERDAKALRRAQRQWALSLYAGLGFNQLAAPGWQAGLGITRTLMRLPP